MKYYLLIAAASAIKLSPYDMPNRQTVWGDSKDNKHPGFEVSHIGFTGSEGLGYYPERVQPAHFQGAGSGDDLFTSSMIENYALEEATPKGVPTGHFVMKKLNAMLAAQEVLATHGAMSGKEAEEFLDKNFEKTWAHFDQANEGKLDVEVMGPFFRYMLGNN